MKNIKIFIKNFYSLLKYILTNEIDVKIYVKDNKYLPKKATKKSACYDIYACLPNGSIIINTGEIKLIPTGLYVEIPDNYFISIRSRSGLALRYGIIILNSPGTIDSEYRGEIQFILINLGKEPFIINDGYRLGQLLIEKSININWKIVNSLQSLTKTERGNNGYGSSGI